MDFIALALRACIPSSQRFLPYEFRGPWSEEEKMAIADAFGDGVPPDVDAMFNNWVFWKTDHGSPYFTGRRATWEVTWSSPTVEGMATYVRDYYRGRKEF